MPTYNVSVQNSNYNVITPAQKNMRWGLLMIYLQSIQNNNIVLDDLQVGLTILKLFLI